MHTNIYNNVYILYATVLLLYLVNQLINSEFIQIILSILSVLALVLAFFKATKMFRVLGIVFLISGAFFYSTTDLSIWAMLSSLKNNFPILTFFMLLPWINSVIKSGQYERLLIKIMKTNTKNLGVLYNRSSLGTFSLATFLNLAAINISQDIVKQNMHTFSDKIRNKMINLASVRSYSIALLWSPLEVLVVLSIFITGSKYIDVVFWLLLIVGIVFLIDNIAGYHRFKKIKYDEQMNGSTFSKKDLKRTFGLLIALGLFLGIIIFIDSLDRFDIVLTITLLIVPFSIVWAIAIKRLRRFSVIGWNAWKQGTNGMGNFIVLFLSLAFFSHAISNSSIAEHIHQLILYFSNTPFLLIVFIQLFILIFSLVGIHSIASIGIIAGMIVPITQIINPVSLAIILITSSISTVAISTFGFLVTLTSVNTGQKPYEITLDNLVFSLLYGFLGTVVAYLLL